MRKHGKPNEIWRNLKNVEDNFCVFSRLFSNVPLLFLVFHVFFIWFSCVFPCFGSFLFLLFIFYSVCHLKKENEKGKTKGKRRKQKRGKQDDPKKRKMKTHFLKCRNFNMFADVSGHFSNCHVFSIFHICCFIFVFRCFSCVLLMFSFFLFCVLHFPSFFFKENGKTMDT